MSEADVMEVEAIADGGESAALAALIAEAEEAEAPAKTKKAVAKAAPKKALFDLSSIAVIEAPRKMSSKFSMVLYGPKGAGKTSLLGDCANVPAWAPILVLATEDGSSVLSRDYPDNPNLRVVNLEDWATAAPLIQAIADNETIYKTVAIDTLPELQEFNKAHITNGGEAEMRIQDWGTMADNTINVVKMLHRSPFVNVIFTSHVEKVQDQETGKLMYSPYLLGKKSLQEAMKPIDIVCYLGVHQDKNTKETMRVLQTNPDGKYDASDRSGKLAPQYVNPTMTDIYNDLLAEVEPVAAAA
jgi:hypothetical protein